MPIYRVKVYGLSAATIETCSSLDAQTFLWENLREQYGYPLTLMEFLEQSSVTEVWEDEGYG